MKQAHKMQAVKRLFSPAVLALALLCWSSTALAGDPIPGVDVNLGKNPGGLATNHLSAHPPSLRRTGCRSSYHRRD